MLARRCGDTDPEAFFPPMTQLLHRSRGIFEGLHRAFDGGEEMFTRLIQHQSVSHPLEQSATHLLFERLEAMAEGRGREMEFFGGPDQPAATHDHPELTQQASVHRFSGG